MASSQKVRKCKQCENCNNNNNHSITHKQFMCLALFINLMDANKNNELLINNAIYAVFPTSKRKFVGTRDREIRYSYYYYVKKDNEPVSDAKHRFYSAMNIYDRITKEQTGAYSIIMVARDPEASDK